MFIGRDLGIVYGSVVLPAIRLLRRRRRISRGSRPHRTGEPPRLTIRPTSSSETAVNERWLHRSQLWQDAQEGLLGSHVTPDRFDSVSGRELLHGRAGLINSGGESSGESDLKDAVKTAVVNKRAGGMGLISGRKAFQRPMAEGVGLLNAIQDVYLSKEVTVA